MGILFVLISPFLGKFDIVLCDSDISIFRDSYSFYTDGNAKSRGFRKLPIFWR